MRYYDEDNAKWVLNYLFETARSTVFTSAFDLDNYDLETVESFDRYVESHHNMLFPGGV